MSKATEEKAFNVGFMVLERCGGHDRHGRERMSAGWQASTGAVAEFTY